MITLQDIWTAADRGREKIAELEYYTSVRSRVSGDITIFNKNMILSMEIYANVSALEKLHIGVNPTQDRTIELLFERIKTLTQTFKT